MTKVAQRGEYFWTVRREPVWSLTNLVLHYHPGERLWITSFDSGELTPTADEVALGWSKEGPYAVSPPLATALEIPHDQFDEWYLIPDGAKLGKIEVFVNFGGFTLVEPVPDPTWDKRLIQPDVERIDLFWAQFDRVRPITYVGQGDNDVVVSRIRQFVQAVAAAG